MCDFGCSFQKDLNISATQNEAINWTPIINCLSIHFLQCVQCLCWLKCGNWSLPPVEQGLSGFELCSCVRLRQNIFDHHVTIVEAGGKNDSKETFISSATDKPASLYKI